MNFKKLPSLLTIMGILSLTAYTLAQGYPQDQLQNIKLRMAEAAISQLYVDSVDETKLVEDAIKGMLDGLDPHSSYTDPEETKDLSEPLAGNFGGIGITFNLNQDTVYVISTVAGGPSEKVGVMAGDRIIAVNDTAIAGVKMKNSEIMKRLRGPKGTDVNVKVLRSTDTVDFRITRDDIPIYSVDAAYMADPTTGYVRVNKFGAETPKEFREALKKLRKQGMKDLVLDLVDNGGGYLNAAVEMLGEILEPGQLAVYTEGLSSPRADLAVPRTAKPLMADGRVVVMVNQNSASASEITSGAIQDWDRGVVVGRRTFGKGLVQRPITFPDGSMMRLTVAHYYTPTGRDIQKPYEKGNAKAYREDMVNRLNSGELMHADSIHYADSLRVSSLRNRRDLYGGGGIYPDSFVPLDTTEYTKYYRNVLAKGLLNRFAIEYVDHHRKQLKKEYKNDTQFVERFRVTDEMIGRLREMAEAEGIEYDAEQAELSRPLFDMVIKGLIGRDIFESATYFKVFNLHDPIFAEAMRIIKSPEYDTLLQPKTEK